MPPLLKRRPSGRRAYVDLVAGVLGPVTRPADPLAVRWAHQIAWQEFPHGKERDALVGTAAHYGVDVEVLLSAPVQELPPVTPAGRRTPEAVSQDFQPADYGTAESA